MLARDANAEAGDVAGKRCGVVGDGDASRCNVAGVVAGDDVHGDSGVFNGAHHGSGVVHGPGEGSQAVAADPSVGGLESDYAAEGGGDADGSAGVAASGDGALAGGRRRAGTAAGTAADQVGVPGVVHVAVVGVLAGGAVGELVHVQLAQKNCARLPEPSGDGAVFGGHEVVVDAGAGGGADSAGVEQVFESHGNAVEGAAVAPGADVPLGLPRLGQRLVGQQGDEGVEHGLGGADAGEVGFDDLNRRNFALLQKTAQIARAGVTDLQFVHVLTPVRELAALPGPGDATLP